MLLKVLRILLGIGAGMLLVANIEPYIALTRMVFGGNPDGVDVCDVIAFVPFVGGVLGWGCGLISAITFALSGFIVWAVFQIIELLPIANSFQIPWISGVLGRLQNAPQVPVGDGDRDAVKKQKGKINTLVERSLAALLAFSWVMYIVDLALMCWLYSPLNSVGELNWMALVRVLLGVFGVELVILTCTLINNVIDPSSIKHAQAQQRPVKEF